MGQQPMAVVAESERVSKYLPATEDHAEAAGKAQPKWRPEVEGEAPAASLADTRRK